MLVSETWGKARSRVLCLFSCGRHLIHGRKQSAVPFSVNNQSVSVSYARVRMDEASRITDEEEEVLE